MVSYTEQLSRRGWSVLVLDSFTTRGERELCTQPLNGRRITQAHRRLDAWGALAWLAAQPGVDSARLGLLGWSHGGSTVLATIDAERLSRRPAEVPLPAFAVAYCPGCAEALQGGVRAGVPVLLQLGQADDWTPAYTCEKWAQQTQARPWVDAKPVSASVGVPGEASGVSRPSGMPVEVVMYPGAHHGFDGEGPVRLRRDVPNGVNRGQGVHVGGDPAARRESLRRLEQWLLRYE
jgi:dienelactone hydrolase